MNEGTEGDAGGLSVDGGAADLRSLGERVARYVVVGRLEDAGPRRDWWAAYDPGLARQVALVPVPAEAPQAAPAMEGPSGVQRAAVARARVVASFEHPHAWRVHDVVEDTGAVLLVGEWLTGVTIDVWAGGADRGPRGAARDRPSTQKVIDALVAVGDALCDAHARGLSHGALDARYVLVSDDGHARIFGLSARDDARRDGAANERWRARVREDRRAYWALVAGLLAESRAGAPAAWQERGGRMPAARPHGPVEARSTSTVEGAADPAWVPVSWPDARAASPLRPRWLAFILAQARRTIDDAPDAPMRALLSTLSRAEGRMRARRRAFLAIGALLGVVTTFVGARFAQAHARSIQIEMCMRAGEALDAAWNDGVRREAQQGLLRAGASHAEATASRVLALMDGYAAQWRQAAQTLCHRGKIDHEWGEALSQAGAECLSERSLALEALAQTLRDADDEVARRAITAAGSLPPIRTCIDERAMRRAPKSPEDQEMIAAVRRTLSQSRAEASAGHFDRASVLAAQALEAAEAAQWPPLRAAALAQVGLVEERKGDYAGAAKTLESAYFAAIRASAPDVAVEAGITLVYVVGYRQSQFTTARVWSRHVGARLDLLGEPPDGIRRAALLNSLAASEHAAGHFAEAQATHQRVREIRETILGPEHPSVGGAINNLAIAYHVAGDLERAKSAYEEAIARWERDLGPSHPDLADPISNLASLALTQGRYDDAIGLHARARSIREGARGPDHPDVAVSLNNLAMVHNARGEYDQARPLFERAQEIWTRALGADDLNVANVLNNLGNIAIAERRFDDALDLHGRSLAIREKKLGSEHADLAPALNNLGNVHQALEQWDRARERYERALQIRERALGRDHPSLAYSLEGLVEVALADRDLARALALAERTVTVRERGKIAPALIAESRFVLARVLWDAPPGRGRDRERALELSAQAHEVLAGAKGKEAIAATIGAWRAERGMP